MKTFLIIVLIALFFLLVFIQIKMIWNNIKFDFNFKGIDLLNIDFSSLTTGSAYGGGNISVPIRATITNDNGFSIPFSGLKVWFYYDNTLVVQTSDDLASKSLNAPANGHIDLVDQVNLYFNTASFNFIKNLASNPEIKYTVKLKVFGIPFSYTNSFNVTNG